MGKKNEYVVFSGCGFLTECFRSNDKELAAIVADAIGQYYMNRPGRKWHVQIRVRETKVEQNIIYDKTCKVSEFPIE